MTKEEIEKAIEDGESVWVVEKSPNLLCEVDKESIVAASGIGLIYFNKVLNSKFRASFSQCFKTQLEALHYANHANMTRTETMPFLTWEEFDKGNRLIRFIGKNGEKCKLEGYQKDDKQSGFIDVVVNGTGSHIDFDYTEANFYKAYDECVKLFLGREN